jgi:hypothetical protein
VRAAIANGKVPARHRSCIVARMKAFAFAVLALTCACAPGRTTFQRYPNAAPTFDRTKSDAKAVELADKVVAAAGGMDKWNTVKQIRWSEQVSNAGKVVIDGEEGWDRWNARHYGRVFGDHGDVVIKRDLYGERHEAWGEQPGDKKMQLDPKDAEPATKIAVERWQFDTAALCMPFLLEEPGSHLAYTGLVKGESAPLEVITLTFDPNDTARAGTSYQIGIDPATSTIERIEVVKTSGNLGYKLSGWTNVNGMKFPTVYNNLGLATEVINVKDIKIGDPEDSLYVTF